MPKTRVSLEPKILRVGNTKEEDVLMGSRCRACLRYWFPPRLWCAACAKPSTEMVELSRYGTLVSYSLVTKKPRYSLVEPPYVLGEVLIPEGVRVYTVVDSTDVSALCVGQKVRLNTLEIKQDEEGASIVAYAFAPAGFFPKALDMDCSESRRWR